MTKKRLVEYRLYILRRIGISITNQREVDQIIFILMKLLKVSVT